MDAGAEIIGEIIGCAIDGAATSSSNDRRGCGCLILIAIALVLGVIIYYAYFDTPEQKVIPIKTCGKIIYKLENDSVLVDVNGKKKLFHISHDLYENKKENDSLCITK